MDLLEINTRHITRFGMSEGRVHRLLRRWKLFSTIFGVSFVLCLGGLYLLPRKYESRMKLLVSNERQDLVITPRDDRNGSYPSELAETRLNSEIELLRSRDVLKQVAVKQGMAHEPGTVIASGQPSETGLERAIGSLERHLAVEPVKRSEIIVVTYRAKNPEKAKAVLSDLADTYLGVHLKAHASPGSFQFFDEQTKAYSDRLAQSEEQLREFRQGHASAVQSDEKDAFTARFLEAQASLEDASAQEAEYRERAAKALKQLANLDTRVTAQVRKVPQTALIAQLNGMLAQLENKRTEMVSKFRPDDRFVTELDAQIASTKAALEQATSQPVQEQTTDINQVRLDTEKNLIGAQVAISGLKAKRERLGTFVDQYKKRMVTLASEQTEAEKLERQVKEDEENYLLYAKKREEARIADSLDQQKITNVSLIEAPTANPDPVFPQMPSGIAASVLLSGLLAFVGVNLWERVSESIVRAEAESDPAAAAAA